MRMALEALERSETTVQYEGFGMARRDAERKHQAAIDALRAALAEPVEPVACEWPSCGCRVDLGEDWKACSPEAALPQNPSTV